MLLIISLLLLLSVWVLRYYCVICILNSSKVQQFQLNCTLILGFQYKITVVLLGMKHFYIWFDFCVLISNLMCLDFLFEITTFFKFLFLNAILLFESVQCFQASFFKDVHSPHSFPYVASKLYAELLFECSFMFRFLVYFL